MPRKVFQLQVELDVQAVTCPGVWLCPNGDITLQLFMLDSCIQTSPAEPVFPLLYHEKFIFYKIFSKANRLSELQKSLNKERLYAELIQWHNCESGNVLATFEKCLSDLLYPTAGEGAIAGVDIDLLMESTKCFPGIISPKIEISTRTTVEETLCKNEHRKCTAFVINPKVIRSRNIPAKTTKLHQRKVCHSIGYHRSKRVHLPAKHPKKPPFVVRRVDEDLISRKPTVNGDDACTCRLRRSKSESSLLTSYNSKYSHAQRPNTKRLNFSPFKTCKCSCRKQPEDSCPICDRYKNLSKSNLHCCQKDQEAAPVRTKMYNSCFCQLPKMHPEQIRCGCNASAFKKPLELFEDSNKNSFTTCCKGCYSNANDSDCLQRDMCLCVPKQSSLATQLHERLTNTLKQSATCIPCDSIENCKSRDDTYNSAFDSDRFSDSTCPRRSHRNNKRDFYENIEKFYDRLFRKQCVCTQ